jgi:hypothetical protein
VEKYMDPDVHPIEIWYYSGNPKFVRASFFRLLFFQRHGTGEFELYNQFLDGPKSLVTYIDKKLTGVDENLDPDARAAIILEREVSFELADAAVSALPGQKGQGGLASQILLGEVETIPHKKVDDDYAIEFLEHKAVVEVSYSGGSQLFRPLHRQSVPCEPYSGSRRTFLCELHSCSRYTFG